MRLNQVRRALAARPAQRNEFRAGMPVETPMGRGQVESEPSAAEVKYVVRLDRPFDLRHGSPVERSAFFAFEMERAA